VCACRFLYLDKLGASKHLMSVSVTLTCVAEVPVFHFSGAIIKRIGLTNSAALVLVAFVVRLSAYSTMGTWPTLWLVLLVEPLHGLTFGLAWATGTAFAKAAAPRGLEATMQSAFASSYFGLGAALSNLCVGMRVVPWPVPSCGWQRTGPRSRTVTRCVHALCNSCELSSVPSILSSHAVLYRHRIGGSAGRLDLRCPGPGALLRHCSGGGDGGATASDCVASAVRAARRGKQGCKRQWWKGTL
jgi:MFS family permease